MKRSIVTVVLLAANAGYGQTCIPLTRADVYSMPRETLDRAYCSISAETYAAMKRYNEALNGPGFGSIQFKTASAAEKACIDALLVSDTLYQERYGKPSPDCEADKAQAPPK